MSNSILFGRPIQERTDNPLKLAEHKQFISQFKCDRNFDTHVDFALQSSHLTASQIAHLTAKIGGVQ